MKVTATSILKWIDDTEELLIAKGFATDGKDYAMRLALLHTEVAELTDAFKKGFGKVAEGKEIADIIIRLTNIPLVFPEVRYKMAQLDDKINWDSVSDLGIFNTRPANTIDQKYIHTLTMHRVVTELGNLCAEEYCDLDAIVTQMMILIHLCRLYSSHFLKRDVGELVKEKMKENWSRPYRYNTAP